MKKEAIDASSSQLTHEEVRIIEQRVERAPDQDLTYAQVFAIKQLPSAWQETGGYYKADTDSAESNGFGKPSDDAPQIKLSATKTTYSIHTTHHGFSIPRGDIETARAWGRPLNAEYADRATRKVQEDLNKLAYVGVAEVGASGIVSLSNATSITGTDWGTSNLDLANEVISYMNEMPVVYRSRPYTLVLADQEYKRLQQFFNSSSAVGDRSHLQRIQSALPNLTIAPPELNLTAGTALGAGGTLADGVALLVPRDQSLVNMPLAMAPSLEVSDMDLNKGIKAEVMARAGPVEVVHEDSVGIITGLNG